MGEKKTDKVTSPAGSLAPVLNNMLRPVLPILRITVRLGDLDSAFEPVNTVLGKKQRLQALSYYYEPITDATANTETEAYTNCLQAYNTLRGPFAGAADVEADLQSQIRTFVVEDGVLPTAGVKHVQLPGTITLSVSRRNLLGALGFADGHALPAIRFIAENGLWSGNAALGKIPIIATVEEEWNDGWSPTPDRWVHFQLIPPYYDAPGSEFTEVNSLRDQSEQGTIAASQIVHGAGPRIFITNAINFNFAADDPQRYNCHSLRGGKRGLPVRGKILDALPALPAHPSPGPIPVMNAPEDSSHSNAVRVKTNAQGEAGLFFLPSRMGGDVYRLRIFVDPIGVRGSDGTGDGAVAFETGRFEVAKHIRWSRYLEKPLPPLQGPGTVQGIQARLAILGYDVGAVDNVFGPQTKLALTAYQNNYHPPLTVNGDINDAATQAHLDKKVGAYLDNCGQPLGAITFATVASQFAQMNCIMDSTQAQATPKMEPAEYSAAIQWARTQLHATQAKFGLTMDYNVEAMFEDTFDTPHLFTIRHPEYYNRTRGAGVPKVQPVPFTNFVNYWADYWTDAAHLIYDEGGLADLFMRYITGNASVANPPTANLNRYSTPGLTVVRALSASQLMFRPNEPNQAQIVTAFTATKPDPGTGASGMAVSERGCYLFGGSSIYQNKYANGAWHNGPGHIYQEDSLTKNMMHEMGHSLCLRHHLTGGNFLHADGNFREDHDNADRCLMGYRPCEGQYCGKCHLNIRGWDISKMPV